MNFENSVDSKNASLLKEIREAGVQIDFEIIPAMESWAVQHRHRYAISAPNEVAHPEGLAHELLHIKLFLYGFLPTHIITEIYTPYNCCFCTSEINNIQNLLGHLKMFPEFVAMGYSKDQFLINGGNEFYLQNLLPTVEKISAMFSINRLANEKPGIQLITEFVIAVICIKQAEVEYLVTGKKDIDTEGMVATLEAADLPLYTAVYSAIDGWVKACIYNNLLFYNNLNFQLYNLGFPPENDWLTWQTSK